MEVRQDKGGSSGKTRRKPGRVPTSCAECRRLKLRCDKNVPCEKCVTRGVSSLCPQYTLPTGKGSRTRAIIANTEELHDEVETLRRRVRELEDELYASQTVSQSFSSQLQGSGEALQTKTPVLQDYGVSNKFPPKMEEGKDNFHGTLRIGSYGQTTFLGRTARPEYIIRALMDPRPATNVTFPRLPTAVVEATFPEFHGRWNDSLGREIFALLPHLSEATYLCGVYLEHGKCLYTSLPPDELFDILPVVYRAESFESFEGHHILSLLFIIFALAVLFDLERKPNSIEAQEYYLLSRASLCLSPPGRQPSLHFIQSLIHIAQYLEFSDCEPIGTRGAWMYAALGVQSGYSMGLHLNSAHWNLNEDITHQRSRIFWQLFHLDTWISLSTGRPPSISPAHIDCEFAKDIEQVVNKDGQAEMGFHSWSWRYTKLVSFVVTTAFGTKVPPYSTILDLDRRIRDFPVPYHLRPVCKDDRDSPSLHLQRCSVHFLKETTLLNLHRSYFGQALHDLPKHLLRHKYGPSVMATYRSAWRLVESLALFWKEIPRLLARVNLAWSQALSAAVVMCLLVTRSPSSCLTTYSMEVLDKVTALFAEAAPDCRAAATNLDSIRTLCHKARESVDTNSCQGMTRLTLAELDRLSGRTFLLCDPESEAKCTQDTNHHPLSASGPTSIPNTPGGMPFSATSTIHDRDSFWDGGSQEEVVRPQQNMHSTIAQDMMFFDGLGMERRPSSTEVFDYPVDSLPPDSPSLDSTGTFDGLDIPPFGSLQNITSGYQLPNTCSGSGPAVLDPWQSFKEQLGFF